MSEKYKIKKIEKKPKRDYLGKITGIKLKQYALKQEQRGSMIYETPRTGPLINV